MPRERLPDTRPSVTKTMRIVGAEPIYATAGFFPDGRLAEIFVFSHAGNQVSALCDALAMAISIGLQHGIPAESFTGKMRGFQIAPRGFTGDEEFPVVSSFLDYLARWIDRLVAANGKETTATPG